MELLGPEGVQRRMAEIRARLEEAFPRRFAAENAAVAPRPLSGQPPLSGAFGSQGFAPFDPNSAGLSLQPARAPDHLQPLIGQAAGEAGIEPSLLDALVAVESAYDPAARSRAGALGLTQLMPDTAKALGVANPFDPLDNLRGGARYLAQMLSRFGGDLRLALAGYNAGPNAVDRFSGVPPYGETQAFVERVLSLYQAKRSSE